MSQSKKEQVSRVQHPLAGSSFTSLVRLILKSGGVDKPYYVKLLYVLVISTLGIPLRVLETIRFDKQIRNTTILFPPIFVLGHWRSGTTHLHRLMTEDPNLGYISSLQAFLPENFLSIEQNWGLDLRKLWPEVRVMDNVSYSPTVPEEEEYALGNVLPLSFYQCWYFPRKMQEMFNQGVLLDDISPSLREEWKAAYLRILKKTTLQHNGKQLVVKNPANTARIPILLELFPDAKFIHIYRNPYDVYTSMKHFYKKLLPHYRFQDISDRDLEENIFSCYRQLMQRFFDTVDAIPPQNFIEISYEEFDHNEVEVLRRIYTKLAISGFEAAEANFKRYMDTHTNYQKNSYVLDDEVKEKVHQQWGFAIDRWQLLDSKLTSS
jgi:omega-hydroxy-beta-dihydromenaquinone-9 sulfotransferase